MTKKTKYSRSSLRVQSEAGAVPAMLLLGGWWCVRVLARPATKGATEGFESRVIASSSIDYLESDTL